MNKAVFFDRDGVVVESKVVDGKPYPINNLINTHIYCGMRDTMAMLMKMGYYVFIVTNQPDVARGITAIEDVNEVNQFLLDNLPVDELFMCIHDDADNCSCRKPKSGMLLKAKEKYNIDLENSFMVGDTWKDIETGYSVGCTNIFIDRKYKDMKWSFHTDFVIDGIDEILEVINAN